MNRTPVLLAPAVIALLLPFAARTARAVVDAPEPWEDRFFTVLLSGEDRDAYERLAEPERAEWRRIYWAERNPTPTTETNENEREHQDRVVRTIREFRDEEDRFVWDDRARAAIRFGFPERVEDFADDGEARREIWILGDRLFRFDEGEDGYAWVPVRDGGEGERRAFERLGLDPAEGRAMAGRGDRAWSDVPASFSFDPGVDEGADLIVGAYACPGTGGADLLITLSLPEEAFTLEGKGKNRKALAGIRIAVRDEAYRLLASKESVREPRAPSREERGRFLLTDSLVAPPGPCRISVRAADGRTGDVAVRTIPFDVPDFSGETVRIGGPILASKIRRLTGGDGVILRRGNRIEPRPGGVFRTDEEANVYFEIENLGIGRDRRSHFRIRYRLEAEGGGDFSSDLGGDEGGALRAGGEKSSRVMSRDTGAERRVTLDLSTLPPGRYTLHIAVVDETNGAEDRVAAPFEVARP